MSRRSAAVAAALAVATACSGLLCCAGAAAAAAHGAGSARGAPGDGTWGKAETVPGLAALNRGGFAYLDEVSCAAPGDCGAGGSYLDGSHRDQAFVVTQRNGTWATAEEVPGTAALNKGPHANAAVLAVSCTAPGDCGAGGIYSARFDDEQSFVVSEVNGRWGRAEEVPGLAALNQDGDAQLYSMSCAAPGDCAAGGYYSVPNARRAFVVTETNGTWGKAEEVPGTAVLNKYGDAAIESVSCAAPGECSAGGHYSARSGLQAFVVTQADGNWGRAEEVPGLVALNNGGWAQVDSVSCAAPGQCSAGGFYLRRSGAELAFLVGQSQGVWGTAERVTGLQAEDIESVSCAAPGECSAVGGSQDGSGFVVAEKHGAWGKAEEVPGLAALNQGGGDAMTVSVSCAAPGECSAGGSYVNSSASQSYVAGEQRGVWGAAQQVPGTAGVAHGSFGGLTSVSCTAPGDCSAGGYYTRRSDTQAQAYVVSETADAHDRLSEN